MRELTEIFQILESVRALEERGMALHGKARRKTLDRLESLLRIAFPAHAEYAREIAECLLGEAAPPLPPQWWKLAGERVAQPSVEEEALSRLLAESEPEYLPDDDKDPITSLYMQQLRGGVQSYLVFALLFFLRALLWGMHRFWVLRGKLVPIRSILERVYGIPEETIEGMDKLSRKHGSVPLSTGRQSEVILSEFFAIPGSLRLLDALGVVYGDVVVGLRRAEPQGPDKVLYPRTPVPSRDDRDLAQRVRVLHGILGNIELVAKAFRMRKATALELLHKEVSDA
jgi:hypothetical protein